MNVKVDAIGRFDAVESDMKIFRFEDRLRCTRPAPAPRANSP